MPACQCGPTQGSRASGAGPGRRLGGPAMTALGAGGRRRATVTPASPPCHSGQLGGRAKARRRPLRPDPPRRRHGPGMDEAVAPEPTPWAEDAMTPLTAAPAGRTETLIVSDLHLGLPASRPTDLLQLLESWRYERLILLGDVFHQRNLRHLGRDAWRLLAFIRGLARADKERVVCLSGNHDRSLREAMATLVGVGTVERFVWQAGHRRCIALHGDCFDEFISRHPRLCRTISEFYAWLQRTLPSSEPWPGRFDGLHSRLWRLGETVAARAAAHAEAEAFDVVVCGHTHEPLFRRFGQGGQEVAYVNAGAWVTRPASFVTIDESAIRLNAFP